MPQTAHQKCDDYVHPVAERGYPVASKGNIDIIPKPGGQGNMPASPEFFDRRRKIGTFKVRHKVNAKELCGSDGNVGIT